MRGQVVAKTKKEGPFTEETEIVLPLNVPSIPASYLQHCQLIDINYVLKIIFTFFGW